MQRSKIKMREGKLNHGPPEVLEAKRIAEIKALSYVERLERMFALLELSYKIRTAKKINVISDEQPSN